MCPAEKRWPLILSQRSDTFWWFMLYFHTAANTFFPTCTFKHILSLLAPTPYIVKRPQIKFILVKNNTMMMMTTITLRKHWFYEILYWGDVQKIGYIYIYNKTNRTFDRAAVSCGRHVEPSWFRFCSSTPFLFSFPPNNLLLNYERWLFDAGWRLKSGVSFPCTPFHCRQFSAQSAAWEALERGRYMV
jgi:hypothetical protein